LVLLPLAYFFLQENKPKPRRRKSYPKVKIKKHKALKTGRKAKTTTKNGGDIRKLSDMPKKYRNGCKGKKGEDLGRCLQYWRRYRKHNPLKK